MRKAHVKTFKGQLKRKLFFEMYQFLKKNHYIPRNVTIDMVIYASKYEDFPPKPPLWILKSKTMVYQRQAWSFSEAVRGLKEKVSVVRMEQS